MADLIQIYNLALMRVGHTKRVVTTTENSHERELCSLIYEQSRDTLLRDYPWRFAKRRVALAEAAGDPPQNWQFQYAKPVDCLRVRYIEVPGMRTPRRDQAIPFEVGAGDSSDLIYTDMAEAVLVYTQRVEDVSRFDPLFVSALAYLMSSELAIPLRGKPDLVAYFVERAEREAQRAVAASLNEGKDNEVESEFFGARNG